MKVTEESIGKEVREQICRVMSHSDSDNGHSYVRLPSFYPTGSGAVVRISRTGSRHVGDNETYFVDDAGAGYAEAEALGIPKIFARKGREVAESKALVFSDHSIVAESVSREQLAWAAITVASTSAEALAISMQRMHEAAKENDSEVVFQRLKAIFPTAKINQYAEIRGHSNTGWKVDALMHWQGRDTVFEAVSSHHNSVFAAAAKFSDIKASEHAPGRVAVVRNKASLKTYAGLLSQSCFVIERDAQPISYRGAVEH